MGRFDKKTVPRFASWRGRGRGGGQSSRGGGQSSDTTKLHAVDYAERLPKRLLRPFIGTDGATWECETSSGHNAFPSLCSLCTLLATLPCP